MFKKILHPTDFSPVAMNAFEQAVTLADRYGAHLRVVHAMVLHGYDPKMIREGVPLLEKAYETLERELSKGMDELSRKADVQALDTVFRKGFAAADVILEEIDSYGADLVVMGTYGHAVWRRLFLGGVAEKVVRYSPCPVLTLGREGHVTTFKNILVPVSFSRPQEPDAAMAAALAVEYGARLHMLHVFQEVIPPSFYAAGDAFQWDPELRGRCEAAMDDLLRESNATGVEVVKHVVEGRVSRKVIETARQEGVDLIVMGTRGLSGIDRLLLGSATERVVREAECPVLTVRESVDDGAAD